MATLTTQARQNLSSGSFAGPGRSFPINDPTHARLAISGATRSENAGNISAETAESIKAKARAKLGKSPSDGMRKAFANGKISKSQMAKRGYDME